MGLRSEIFAGEVRSGFEGRARPYRTYGAKFDRAVLLYQGSMGSPVADYLLARPEPKWLYFHNITPRRFLEAWDPGLGMASATGWTQLRRLAPATTAAFANSAYSGGELRSAGFVEPVILAPLVELTGPDSEVDGTALGDLEAGRGGAELLFVGRLSPHKGQHLLIGALAAYRRAYDPHARLHLVGGAASQTYRDSLVRYAAELGLGEAVRLTGSVTGAELAAHYRNADVFVCASAHEGFCVPLLEAMSHELPIVALGSAAVPETLGGAGVLLDYPDPKVMAAAIHRARTDQDLRGAMALAAKRQLDRLGPLAARAATTAAIRDALARLG